jgi:hypothetical protein
MTDRVRCKDCGNLLFEGEEIPSRRWSPCPRCGSTARQYEKELASAVEVNDAMPLSTRVLRGVNPERLAVLLALVTTWAAVGFPVGISDGPLLGIVVGAASAVAVALVVAAVVRGGRLTHLTMELMHRISGR